MTLRNLLTVMSVVNFAFGLGGFLFPAQLAFSVNPTLNASGVFVHQRLSGAAIAFGVLNWLARSVTDTKALNAIVLANLVLQALSFVLGLLFLLGGAVAINQVGWAPVAVNLLFALGFAYFQFIKPGAS